MRQISVIKDSMRMPLRKVQISTIASVSQVRMIQGSAGPEVCWNQYSVYQAADTGITCAVSYFGGDHAHLFSESLFFLVK